MDSGKRKAPLQREGETCSLAFGYVTFYAHDAHHRSP